MDVLSCNCADGLTGPAGPGGLLSVPGVARVWVMRTGTSPSAVSIMLPPGTGYCGTNVPTYLTFTCGSTPGGLALLYPVASLSRYSTIPPWQPSAPALYLPRYLARPPEMMLLPQRHCVLR